MGWASFWAICLQTHLVTLLETTATSIVGAPVGEGRQRKDVESPAEQHEDQAPDDEGRLESEIETLKIM
jgi:hypothetical protein